MFASLIAAVFVVLWSTGFVVARAITPYADPNLFLLARFGGTALIFALAAVTARAAWPTGRAFGKHLVAGALLQGVYLGAGYWAVAQGLSAGVMALLGALQPLATAAVAAPTPHGDAPPWLVVLISIAAVGAITVGTLFQKTSLAKADIRSASAVQNFGVALLGVLLARS